MSAGSTDVERTRVVMAAHALLAEENAASELTIDAVAARAGVARAQVQRRFGTPTRVLEALRDQLLSDHCLALLPNAFQREEPPEWAIEQVIPAAQGIAATVLGW